jgi:hypothetical protein
VVILASLALSSCSPAEPWLSFLDDSSNVSFTHPPRWTVGFAEQQGIRYRYLTAPKVENDTEALSVTLIPPTAATSADAVSEAYLAGASGAARVPGPAGVSEWSFRDSSGVASRLRLASAGSGGFFGAWVRGSEAAMKRYAPRIETLLNSLRVEDASAWPEERFAGLVVHAPPAWTRASRLSNRTNASMQFKSLPLAVEKGTATIHGFVVVSREPVPAPGQLETFTQTLKDRATDTVALLEHRPWPAAPGLGRPEGSVDYLRSGTTLTSTRIRRWITVKNGVGLVFSCEARADAFDRLDPWCRRMADTVHLE